MRFSEMNENKFPHYIGDDTVEMLSKHLCDADFRKNEFIHSYDFKMSIRHHRMTIALAMPERGKR